ncbi:hypothetical protein EJ997_04780 [Flaviflexus ciconiae]|uniref:Uncharacterized protein n=1 Tax=Flaviflexus ciconiae TaxID=2496867 RepID=A0A3Q9G1G2_9ACTO|nr:hypothetical protein EJ997_04780 [Flaviflexus ciconiae]
MANGLDSKLASGHDVIFFLTDERYYFLCWRSSSAPKKAVARLKVSLARRSSRFSCSSLTRRGCHLCLRPGLAFTNVG